MQNPKNSRCWCSWSRGRLAWSAASRPQLLRSSSVAVSTSHDFEDKATITAFCEEEHGTKYQLLEGSLQMLDQCLYTEESTVLFLPFCVFLLPGVRFSNKEQSIKRKTKALPLITENLMKVHFLNCSSAKGFRGRIFNQWIRIKLPCGLTLSKPIAQRFSIFFVYSGLDTGAPAYTCAHSRAVCLNISGFCLYCEDKNIDMTKEPKCIIL